MRILFVGDVVGRSGRTVVTERLPGLIRDWKLDFVVVNGENAAGGFGITETIYNELLEAGADAITLGNHAWDQKEALVFIERAPRLIRPINYPPGTPGRGAALCEAKNGARVLVINAMGRVFMDPLDDPFAAVDRELDAPVRCGKAPTPSSSTCTPRRPAKSRRWAISATAAPASSSAPTPMCRPPTLRILPGGTAFMSDVGMTGDYDSVIGMAKEEPLQRFTRKISSSRFEAATGPATLCGDRGRDRPDDRACRRGSARCGSAAASNRRRRFSGLRLLPAASLFPRLSSTIRPSLRRSAIRIQASVNRITAHRQ